MKFFSLIPETIVVHVRFSVDDRLLTLLQQIADRDSDRKAAVELSVEVKKQADDLAAVIPST